MIANSLSALIGVLFTLAGFALLGADKSDVTISTLTNLVIAAAAVIAVILHCSALKHQRNERVWGIKKEILLKLSHTLSELMNITSKRIDQAFMVKESIGQANAIEENGEQFRDFSTSIRESLFVYRPLLDTELIKAIELYESTDRRVEQDVNDNAMDTHEAYEELYEAQKELHAKLSAHIKTTAGI